MKDKCPSRWEIKKKLLELYVKREEIGKQDKKNELIEVDAKIEILVWILTKESGELDI